MALVNCRECKTEVSRAAKTCPKCGVSSPAPVDPKTTKAILFLVFLAVAVAIAASLGSDAHASRMTASVVPVAISRPVVDPPVARSYEAVELRSFLRSYENNEVRSDGLYKDHDIQISGRVGEIKKDILGSMYVLVGTGRGMLEIPQAQCSLTEDQLQKASKLVKGQKVTVHGRVEGLMFHVQMRDCEIVE